MHKVASIVSKAETFKHSLGASVVKDTPGGIHLIFSNIKTYENAVKRLDSQYEEKNILMLIEYGFDEKTQTYLIVFR